MPVVSKNLERGSIVTFAVAIFMLVALLFYLIVAFFHEDTPVDNPTAASSSASADSARPEKSGDPPAN
ncbi:MAG: hypothetical protein CBC48_12895 [bacterium TMED88]|nr:hypothetical protein [Deltaproteobacteria bacterium]OUV28636.1 MAG: hypothetical protein CBC48_12895 [bacterium TMED88]